MHKPESIEIDATVLVDDLIADCVAANLTRERIELLGDKQDAPN